METNIATELRAQLKRADAEADRLTIENVQLRMALRGMVESFDPAAQDEEQRGRAFAVAKSLLRLLGEAE